MLCITTGTTIFDFHPSSMVLGPKRTRSWQLGKSFVASPGTCCNHRSFGTTEEVGRSRGADLGPQVVTYVFVLLWIWSFATCNQSSIELCQKRWILWYIVMFELLLDSQFFNKRWLMKIVLDHWACQSFTRGFGNASALAFAMLIVWVLCSGLCPSTIWFVVLFARLN